MIPFSYNAQSWSTKARVPSWLSLSLLTLLNPLILTLSILLTLLLSRYSHYLPQPNSLTSEKSYILLSLPALTLLPCSRMRMRTRANTLMQKEADNLRHLSFPSSYPFSSHPGVEALSLPSLSPFSLSLSLSLALG
ncbi:hypothetical protein F5H01DRAFT_357683, partial [Linnemannia elongata]